MALLKFATPKTGKFTGGAFELRFGPLANAGFLGPAYSAGSVPSFHYQAPPDVAEQMGGAPQEIVDTFISGYKRKLIVTPDEFSVRNMNIALGNGVADYNTPGGDVMGVVDTTSAVDAAATTITLKASSPTPGTFAEGDVVTFYSATSPGKTTTATVASYATHAITLVTGQGLLSGYDAGELVYVYKNAIIGALGNASVPYFSATVLVRDHQTGRTGVWNFWKVFCASGLDFTHSLNEFSKNEWTFNILLPVESDYALGGPLYHVADRIGSSGAVELATTPDYQ